MIHINYSTLKFTFIIRRLIFIFIIRNLDFKKMRAKKSVEIRIM